MRVDRVRRYGTGAGLVGGAAVAAALIGAGIARADDSTADLNGWTVTLTGSNETVGLLPAATLSDPGNSLGLGTTPIAGGYDSSPASPLLGSIGSNDTFTTPLSSVGGPGYLNIENSWFPGFEVAIVQPGQDNGAAMSLLAVGDSGKEVVDLLNFGIGSAPLFNPDATGPIDIGGVDLASPDAGALLNNLYGAVFQGNTTDWNNAMTLFDDWLGIGTSGSGSAAASDTTGSNDPLSTAASDFSDAKSVLAGIDVSDAPSDQQEHLSQLVTSQSELMGNVSHLLSLLPSPDASDSGSLSSLVDQLVFEPLDQSWANEAASVLSAAQGLDTAVTGGSESAIAGAMEQIGLADLSLIPTTFESIPDIVLGDIFGGGAGDAAAGADFFDLPSGL